MTTPLFFPLTTARLEKARPAVALRLQVIRTIDVVLLWPLLAYTGHGFSLKGAIVTVWSGLRGVVGMALALLVFLDPNISDEGYKVRVLFFMGSTVCLTVLVQGSLVTPLLKVSLNS
jgi:NhaP-type Na+/H+ or K+/H+ antiporter